MRSVPLSSFAPTVPRSGEPVPPLGPCGMVPQLRRYHDSLRLLAGPPASLRFLRSAVPRVRSLVLARRSASALAFAGAVTRAVPGTFAWRRQGLPSSWRVHSTRALLSDPGGIYAPGHSARRCCLPPKARRRLPRQSSFGAQSHGSRRRCLRFADRVTPAPRKTRFRLVANLGRAGFDPQDSIRGSRCLLPPPGFSWRKPFQDRASLESPSSGGWRKLDACS